MAGHDDLCHVRALFLGEKKKHIRFIDRTLLYGNSEERGLLLSWRGRVYEERGRIRKQYYSSKKFLKL